MNPQGREEAARAAGPGGRLGLALSGGGFRASLFHVGVLARMAALGLLRHVEAISTVSGGSIIGALYYIHVKRLLEAKADAAIEDQDYAAILERIERDFLEGVQRNIRMRTFLDPLKNLRMSRANYSRSDRIGELYDEVFYRPVLGPGRRTPVTMRELRIQPAGETADFHPLRDNARRRAKVPILLVNATTLNTGHNWRFEASRMGEPPRRVKVARDVDKNLRLRRPPSYEAITPRQQDIELGLAVAASACVPGIFHPLAISDLYPEGIRVQLVDGGVHDNQGIEGLLDMGCTLFVVSDASGQMQDEPDPPTRIASVLGRTNGIFMDRIREEELFRLLEGRPGRVAFMHLRRGLPARAVAWIGPDGRPAEAPKREREPDAPSERFGVAPQVQDLLSRIRTDLDSFTEVEAYSLMLDGYLMSEEELKRAGAIRALIREPATVTVPGWRFRRIAPWMARPTRAYLRQLEAAGKQIFKVFRLSPAAAAVTGLLALAVLVGIWIRFQDPLVALLRTPFTLGQLLVAAALLALGFVPRINQVLRAFRLFRAPTDFLVRLAGRAFPPAVGSFFVWIHLRIFDPIFLRVGSLDRLGEPPASGEGTPRQGGNGR